MLRFSNMEKVIHIEKLKEFNYLKREVEKFRQ